MTKDIPVQVDNDSVGPVDIPPMTDDGEETSVIDTSAEISADPSIDPEFKDAVAPKFDDSNPPSPGLTLEYAYYLYTKLGNITSFYKSVLDMVMVAYHKILG
jgi:hypothetical protein